MADYEEQLSDYIMEYIKNKNLVEEMAKYNYEHVKENYHIDKEVQKMEEIFDEEKKWKRKLI